MSRPFTLASAESPVSVSKIAVINKARGENVYSAIVLELFGTTAIRARFPGPLFEENIFQVIECWSRNPSI